MFVKKTFSFLIPLLPLLFACGSQSDHQFIVTTDENGVQICTNRGGPKYAEPLYDLKETLSLGGEEPQPKLFQPRSFLIDSEGFLYFTDDNRIKKFSPDGEFLQFISRPGEGPGEISYPYLKSIIKDTLIVDVTRWSGGKRAYDLFLNNGDWVGKLPFPEIEEILIPDGRVSIRRYLGGNRFLFSCTKREEKANIVHTYRKLAVSDGSGKIINIITPDIVQFNESFYVKTDRGKTNSGLPFIVGFNVVPTPDGIRLLMPSGSEVRMFSSDYKLNKKLFFEAKRENLDESTIQQLKDRYKFRSKKTILSEEFIPEYYPFVCDLVVSESGYLWMRKGKDFYRKGSGPFSYRIISPEGEYLYDQGLPLKLAAIRDNQVYGSITNEDGLRIFKRYKLLPRN